MAEYEPIEKISRTAGSELWRGRRLADGAPVLLKRLPEAAAPAQAVRFRREFDILRALAVPGVPKPITFIEQPSPMIVLEDIGGESLETVLNRRRFDLSEALALASRLARILAGVHALHIVHQDLRPGNLLITPNNELFLTDFHFCARENGEAAPESSLFTGHFDPAYISPEQTGRINRRVDCRTDFYSLGVLLYRLLTGRLPCAGENPSEWLHCHVARPPRLPTEVAELPRAVSELALKLLAKEADDRYQSAGGLRSDLEHCLAQLTSTGRIVPFALGTQDTPDRLRLPQKLYGRETERTRLLTVFERVAESGWPELVVVSGASGVGKSSLVNELRHSIAGRRGYFVAGKFDAYQRDIPYAALAQAFRHLLQQILAETAEELSLRKRRLRDALATSGALMVDFVPPLAQIIGPQPAVAELPPAEAQNRFHRACQRSLTALASAEHPLVLFLDDLHWLDAASLKLLEYVITHPDTRHLMLVGAYRPGGIGPPHPLPPALARIAGMGVKTTDLTLGSLSPAHLNQYVADTLHCDPGQAASLARLIFAKTQGNPFFFTQFLSSLHRQELLQFDREQGVWSWDLARIEAKSITDNILDLIVGKLKRFGDQAEEALRLAGCLGNTFALETLATIWGRSEEETEDALGETVRDGLLLRRDRTYRFLHDHVHQAACELIPVKQRAEVHLKIGRLLLAHTPPDALEERLFEVVTQLNLGAAFIATEEERTRAAELNLRAAHRAKAATAYQAAASYLAAAARILGCAAWEREDPLAFAIFLERAECEFLCGNFGRAEHLFPVLLQHARTRLDKAAVYRIKIDTLTTEGKDEQAIECALECLRIFGIDIPAHPSTTEVEAAYEEVWRSLGTRDIEGLLELPLMTDPETQAAMDILARLYAPAYHLDNNLFYLHLCQGVNISLRHGISPASTHAYGWFGVVLTCVFHRPVEGGRFARLAFALMERHRFMAYQARAIFVLRVIAYWTEPLERMLEYSRAAFEAAVETGDVPGACFSRNHTVMGMLLRGDHLAEVQREAERALQFVQRAGFRDVHDMILGIERFAQAMRGNTRHLATYDDGSFNEASFEGELADRMPTLLFYYFVVKLMARYLAGDYQGALAAAEKSHSLLWAGLFSAQGHCFHVYHALTLAAVFDTLPSDQRGGTLDLVAGHRESLRQAAEDYPPTFHHTYSLVAAEIARIEGRELEAERLYEAAIRSAKDNGFVQDEGMANELAGRFHLARGLTTVAEAYLRQARGCYACWGAEGKVRQLDAIHPQLKAEPTLAPGTLAGERLPDVMAIVKASQAISEQIVLDRLLDTLMRHVMASAGARKGHLLLARPEGLVLAAEAQAEDDKVDVQLHREKREFAARLPASLLHHVRSSRERTVLTDAEPNPFASDDYFSRHHPRSALCLPIICRAELIGLLYLENDRVANLFTPNRLAVLDLLASQAAISLDNSLLYRNLRQENVERRRAEWALRASETRFRTGFAHAVNGMALLDIEGRFTQVNRSLCDMLGYSEAELLGRHFTEITHPEDIENSRANVGRLLAGEAESFQMNKRYLHKGGQVILAEMSVAYFRPGEGEAGSFVVQIQDITERRRAEEAVRESQRLLQSIIDNSTALIYVKDLEGRYLLANRRCEEVFHIVAGLSDYDLFPKEQADLYRAADQGVIASAAVLQAEDEAPLEDGVHTYITLKAPLRDSSGRVYAVCGVSTDITERKKAERHQTVQFAIAGVLAGSANLGDAASRLLQILCETLGWELGELWITDAKAALIRLRESWHVPELAATGFVSGSRGRAFALGVGLPGRVWRKGEPEWMADVLTDTQFIRRAMATEAGLHGALAFPIRLDRDILGVMAFFSRQMRRPEEELLQNLAAIGSQIGQFIERKRAEEELRISEERYRALHRDNPTMIFTLDTQGTVLSVNPFGASQLGYAIEELEGQPVLNVFHKEDRPAVAEQLRNCLDNPNQVYRWHFRKIRKDGALLWVEELAQAVYGPEGTLNVLVVCQDITERLRAEEARKNALIEAEAARDKIDAILKSVADGLLVTDLADRLVLMNDAAEALLGIRFTDTSGQHIDSLLAEENLRRQIAGVRRGEQEKAISELERRAGGQMRVLQAQTTARRSTGGQLAGTITILRDITREREIDRMKDEFISTAAHELRTPLTTVMGYVELLLQNEQAFAPEERREFLELVYRNSETLERLINDLLDLSTVQAGRLITLNKSRVDLAVLVGRAVAAWQGLTDRHRILFEFAEAPVHLCFDAGKIAQVLENLLSNAVKFSPAGGAIRVRGHRTDGEFEVIVEDEGIGMRPEQVARIFDKFYRADASDTAIGGLGLGMNIVRNIVEAHGGRIWVESEPGRETRVHFTLPGKDRAAECKRRFS